MSCAPDRHAFVAHPFMPQIFCTHCGVGRDLIRGVSYQSAESRAMTPVVAPAADDDFEPIAADAQADANILQLIRQANEPVNEETIEAARVILSMNGRAENIEVDGEEYVPRRVRAQPEDDTLPDAGL